MQNERTPDEYALMGTRSEYEVPLDQRSHHQLQRSTKPIKAQQSELGFDRQSNGGMDLLDSNRSLSSLQMQMFKDTNTEHESTEDRRRGRRKNKLEIEGLFRESDSSGEDEAR